MGRGTTPMIFAHGFGCDQNMWRLVTPYFEEDYKIILFDYVGSGKSDYKAYNFEKYSHLKGYAQDILDICADLELENVIFVGHSVSAMIGLLAANENPRLFAKNIYLGPSPRYINDTDYFGGFSREDIEGLLEVMDNNYMGWASMLAPMVMQNNDRPELTQELQESFCSTDPVITRNFAKVTFLSDNRSDLSQSKIPTLILQCTEDAIAPVQVGEFVHKNLQNSTFQLLDASGHCPHLSNPVETVEIIKNFLNNTLD